MFKDGRIFGREPVLITAFLAVLIQVVSSLFLHWTDNQQAVLNGFISLLLGALAAAAVKFDKALPLLVGLVQGAVAVAVAFGVSITDTQLSTISALVAAGVALWTRDRVTAPVDAAGTKVNA